MAKVYDTATLKQVELDDKDVPAAVLSGRYGVASEEKLLLYRPDGKLFTMLGKDAPSAFADGYTYGSQQPLREQQAEEKFGKVGAAVLPGAAGLARGLSIGGSDWLATQAGVPAEDLTLLRESSPTVSTVTEVVGAVAPVLFSGGTGAAATAIKGAGMLPRGIAALGHAGGKAAAAKLGLGTGKSLLAKMGTAAVKQGVEGVIEGAIYGGAHAINEAVLGDHEVNAQSIIADAGLGALVGGGAGVLLGGGGALISGVGEKVSAFAKKKLASLPDKLDELADESAVKATGARGADIQNLGTDGKIQQIGEDLRGYVFKNGNERLKIEAGEKLLQGGLSTKSMANRLSIARKEVGAELGAIREKASSIAKESGEFIDTAAYFKSVDDDVIAPLMESYSPTIRRQAKKVVNELADIRKAAEKDPSSMTLEVLEKRRSDLADIIWPKKPKGKGPPPTPPRHAQYLMQAERKLADFIEQKTDDILKAKDPALSGEYLRLRQLDSSMITADQLAAKATKQNLSNRWVSPSDYGVGAAAGVAGAIASGPAGLLLAGVGALSNKLVRERGRSTVAVLADKLSAKVSAAQGIQRAAETTERRIASSVRRFAQRVSATAKTTTQGARRAVADESVKHAVTHPDTVALDDSVIRRRQAIPVGASMAAVRLMHKDEKPENRREATRTKTRELAKLVADPQRLADRISASTSAVSQVAPKTADAMAMSATRALQYLHANAPKNPSGPSLTPKADKWLPTDDEVSRFDRRTRAAFDPLSILDDLEHGTLSREGVETVRELYPKIHQMTLQKISEELAESETKLPYADRVNMSLLFGLPTDETMSPDFIRGTQAVFTPKPPAGQGGGGQRVTPIGKLGLAENTQTTAQRLGVER